ncbi:serine/threonine protein phosphatase [Vibrio ponticus]|uniref:Serine/threonine protein phosphatase n=1 Tax=Vibrio ponticus TaxID=265668 RepID=A0ABX3F3K5_9VIBR|nr:metallophosphoesterase family protein [Vibrio ponticus]OLQ84371.1 serine/threonine protein phosphatase [Vibrio ponticus]
MSKYALVSDIHSNYYALKAVVEHARAEGVDKFINLGDILYGPIAPKATFELLQSLDTITICGNQDRQIYQAGEQEISSNPTMQFILQDLGVEPIEWMTSLPFDCQISEHIYACHGTPSDDLVYLLEETEQGFPILRSDKDILDLLQGNASPVILCGHTHIPRCVELSTGQLVINPGSVGMPAYTDDEPHLHSMETYSSKASYAILSQSESGGWDVAFHKVSYPVEFAAEQANLRDRQDWVHFLTTGRGQ